VNLVSGDGAAAKKTDVFVENGKIAELSSNLVEEDAAIVDLTGKTMMPALISTHVHIGTLKDTTANGRNYTRENILNN
jgi:dihydroorotase-like cyclic amidohydrolase